MMHQPALQSPSSPNSQPMQKARHIQQHKLVVCGSPFTTLTQPIKSGSAMILGCILAKYPAPTQSGLDHGRSGSWRKRL